MSEDLIKRSDAIKDLCDISNNSDMPNDWHRGMSVAISALYRVPPVPPADRPQGEWLAVSSYDAFGGSEELWNAHGNPTAFHYCSKCKAQSYVNEFGEELLTDYCPNCGAKMK